MKTTLISVILEHLSDSTVLEAFQGKVTKLYPMKHLGSGDKAFTKQNGELTDSAGDIIPVEFLLNGSELPQDRKGRSCLFKSVKGDKGTHGVKVIDDTYQEKTTRKLRITPTCSMEWDDGGSTSQVAPQQSAGSAPATQSAAQRPASSVDGQRAGMAINNAVKIIEGWNPEPAYYMSEKFGLDLWHIASRIIRVSGALEQGKLDPKTAKEKTEEQKKAEADKAEAAAKAAAAERKRLADEAAAKAAQQPKPPANNLDDLDEVPF